MASERISVKAAALVTEASARGAPETKVLLRHLVGISLKLHSTLSKNEGREAGTKTMSTFRRCAFHPSGRSVNCVAVRADGNDVRQLATKGKIAWNVNALGGVIAEIGRPVLGVEDEDLFVQVLADEVKRSREIGIATDQGERTCPSGRRALAKAARSSNLHSGFFLRRPK